MLAERKRSGEWGEGGPSVLYLNDERVSAAHAPFKSYTFVSRHFNSLSQARPKSAGLLKNVDLHNEDVRSS